jgi:hypothetical protein
MATLECKREETAVLLSCQADSVKLVSALHAARREVQQVEFPVVSFCLPIVCEQEITGLFLLKVDVNVQAEALSVDEAEREAIERFLRKRTVGFPGPQ